MGEVRRNRFLLIGAFRSSASLSKTAGASEKSALGHLFELARVFGKLKSLGWRPHRSLVFAVWASQDSAAEFQHGMDAYLSRNLPDLKDQLVAYLHVDSPVVSGATSLNVLADALLRESLYEAAKKIPHHDPTRPSHSNFYESWLSSSTVEVVVPGQLFDSAWMKDHLRDLTRSNAYHQVYPSRLSSRSVMQTPLPLKSAPARTAPTQIIPGAHVPWAFNGPPQTSPTS
ncbi:unnamed protein product [Cyprideis torosa]|uniref:Uncharacterized protein n=1 Tax=Cyprideis torosa TaxID=163714 RepID=A0A7R8WBF6_9CRUS|nr:unnamed protein product [Cyprideis torosa]CAG0887323.1 unnamed protein product [Cyprideis torosa]